MGRGDCRVGIALLTGHAYVKVREVVQESLTKFRRIGETVYMDLCSMRAGKKRGEVEVELTL